MALHNKRRGIKPKGHSARLCFRPNALMYGTELRTGPGAIGNYAFLRQLNPASPVRRKLRRTAEDASGTSVRVKFPKIL